jgi:hypothetical protein
MSDIHCKFYFRRPVCFLVSHAVKLVRLIRIITSSFPTLGSLLMLYFLSVRSKLEHASDAWNSDRITDSNKFEPPPPKRKFAAFCKADLSKIWDIIMIIYWKD